MPKLGSLLLRSCPCVACVVAVVVGISSPLTVTHSLFAFLLDISKSGGFPPRTVFVTCSPVLSAARHLNILPHVMIFRLACHRCGWGNWHKVRAAILASPRFTFDYYLRSLSETALGKHCEQLMKSSEKYLVVSDSSPILYRILCCCHLHCRCSTCCCCGYGEMGRCPRGGADSAAITPRARLCVGTMPSCLNAESCSGAVCRNQVLLPFGGCRRWTLWQYHHNRQQRHRISGVFFFFF